MVENDVRNSAAAASSAIEIRRFQKISSETGSKAAPEPGLMRRRPNLVPGERFDPASGNGRESRAVAK